MSEPWRTIVTLLAGVATGVLSGMFGVGGAVVSTPTIRLLGASPLQSVGSTLPSILPSALSGSMRYGREGFIVGRVVKWVGGIGSGAAVGGALLAGLVPGNGHVLMIATAALLAFTAYRMARPALRPAIAATPHPRPPDLQDPVGDLVGPLDDLEAAAEPATALRHRDEWWRLAVIGVGAGGLSGLLGIGGGLLMVPAFAGWVRLEIKRALGTSLACVGILAVPGTITHTVLGHIDWAFAVPLSIAVIPGAQLGAHLAIRSSARTLRLAVGIMLGTIAIIYAAGEIIALL